MSVMSIEDTIKWLKENKTDLIKDADKGQQPALVAIKAFQIYMAVSMDGEDVSGPPTLNLVNAVQDYIDSKKPPKKKNKWEKQRDRANKRRVMKNLAKIQKSDDVMGI